MVAGKRKRTRVQIRTGILLHKDAMVTRLEVTRKTKQRILAKSSRVSVPVTETSFPQPPPSQTPEPQSLILDPNPPTKKPRKGPSRSVAVTPFNPFHFLL